MYKGTSEQIREAQRKYRLNNKDKLNARARERDKINRIRLREREKAYRLTPQGISWNRNKHLMYRYKLSITDYDEMLDAQNGVCAICKQPEKLKIFLSVDHDHKCCPGRNSCGKCIRGLLCYKCNTRLKHAESEAHWYGKATIYLQRK